MLETIRKLLRRKSRIVKIRRGQSYHAKDLSLVISSDGVWYVPNPKGEPYRNLKSDAVDLVIGAPGLPNVKKELQLGETVLYQTPDFGVVEIRVVEIGIPVKLLISEVSPRRGFAASLKIEEFENASFASDETAKIAKGLASVAARMAVRPDVTSQQLAMLNSKLEEITEASARLGRKDWILFAAGTLTNLIVGAAFAPEAAKALFSALNTELSWVFQNALRLTGS
jgi:hypothetical protein